MHQRVEVEWVDSFTHDRWSTPLDVSRAGLAVCQTVGYLIHDEQDRLVLAQSYSLDDVGGVEEYGQCLTIPRVAVNHITPLHTQETQCSTTQG